MDGTTSTWPKAPVGATVSGSRRAVGQAIAAGGAVVAATATGLVTNVLSQDWSWTFAAILLVLTVGGVVLAAVQHTAAAPRSPDPGRATRPTWRVDRPDEDQST